MQAFMSFIDSVALPLSLWTVMFAMGLSLQTADFKALFLNRRAFVLGLLSMALVVPIVGSSIAIFAMPTPALTMGFILLATCPGGLLSNLLTSLSRGDLALSVSLSLSTSVLYLFTLPFIAHYAFLFIYGQSEAVTVPLGSSLWQILRITVLPIACGMTVRRFASSWTVRFLPGIKLAGTVALVIIFGFIVADNFETLRRSFGVVLATVIGMNIVNALIALGISFAGGLSREERIAVVIEHLIRQETTAIYVAVTVLGHSDMSLPMIINTFVGMAVCLTLIAILKRRRASTETSSDREIREPAVILQGEKL